MEDECYPAISLKTATSNLRSLSTATIDPRCLTITTCCSPLATTNTMATTSSNISGLNFNSMVSTAAATLTSQSNPTLTSTSSHNSNIYAGLCKIATSTPITLNLRQLDQNSQIVNTCTDNNKQMVKSHQQQQLQQPALQHQSSTHQQQHQHQHMQILQQQQYLPQDELACIMDDCDSSMSSREGSQSPDICSDIEIDESCIKNEPMSPDSSCPSSPAAITTDETTSVSQNNSNSTQTLSLTMANMAAFTNSDLVFEHKVSIIIKKLLGTVWKKIQFFFLVFFYVLLILGWLPTIDPLLTKPAQVTTIYLKLK